MVQRVRLGVRDFKAFTVGDIEFGVGRHTHGYVASLDVEAGCWGVGAERAGPFAIRLGVVTFIVIRVAVHGPARGQGLEIQQQAFVDKVEAVRGLRAFGVAADEAIRVDGVGDVRRSVFVWRAEPAAVGVEGGSTVDALLAEQVEVPGLIALRGNAAIAAGWSDVAGRILGVCHDIVGRADLAIWPGRQGDGLAFGADDVAVVVNPALVAGQDLNRASE